jgi:hypothetical protein
LKALFIGGALDGIVRDVDTANRGTQTHRHRRSSGDHVYTARKLAQVSTGKTWLIFVRGKLPSGDKVFAMVDAAKLPAVEDQRAAPAPSGVLP